MFTFVLGGDSAPQSNPPHTPRSAGVGDGGTRGLSLSPMDAARRFQDEMSLQACWAEWQKTKVISPECEKHFGNADESAFAQCKALYDKDKNNLPAYCKQFVPHFKDKSEGIVRSRENAKQAPKGPVLQELLDTRGTLIADEASQSAVQLQGTGTVERKPKSVMQQVLPWALTGAGAWLLLQGVRGA